MLPPHHTQYSLRVIPREFYQRATAVVARDLLGTLVISRIAAEEVVLRINEVEAYLGPRDRACHTWGGRRTTRVASMWGPVGRAYVYVAYGLHRCLNVVTGRPGSGEAVLIRGGWIVEGSESIRRRRGPRVSDRDLVNGPGKLAQALGVVLEHDGLDLASSAAQLFMAADGYPVVRERIHQTPRIGISGAGEAAAWRLRWKLEAML